MSRSSVREGGSTPSVYLDWNATAPPHPDVLEAMLRAARNTWGNPASVHAVGRAARAIVEDARKEVADLFAVSERDVVLTSGATEANNLALAHAPAIVTSRLEHPSVVRVAEAAERAGKLVHWAIVPETGCLAVSDIERELSGMPPGFVVALMAANHETGVLQPVAEVAEVVRACGGRLHVDAAQAVGKVEPSALHFGDSSAVAGHKLRGPKGIGALVLRRGELPRPVLLGGAQERGVRPGTVDPVAAAGFAVAIHRARESGPARAEALRPLRDRIESALSPFATFNGQSAPRLPHVTSIAFHDGPGDELVAALDLAGVHVSSGSACSAGTQEASPVITSMRGKGVAERTIRVSLGETTSEDDVEHAIRTMIRLVTRQSSSA